MRYGGKYSLKRKLIQEGTFLLLEGNRGQTYESLIQNAVIANDEKKGRVGTALPTNNSYDLMLGAAPAPATPAPGPSTGTPTPTAAKCEIKLSVAIQMGQIKKAYFAEMYYQFGKNPGTGDGQLVCTIDNSHSEVGPETVQSWNFYSGKINGDVTIKTNIENCIMNEDYFGEGGTGSQINWSSIKAKNFVGSKVYLSRGGQQAATAAVAAKGNVAYVGGVRRNVQICSSQFKKSFTDKLNVMANRGIDYLIVGNNNESSVEGTIGYIGKSDVAGLGVAKITGGPDVGLDIRWPKNGTFTLEVRAGSGPIVGGTAFGASLW
jgi:hypothetical protein